MTENKYHNSDKCLWFSQYDVSLNVQQHSRAGLAFVSASVVADSVYTRSWQHPCKSILFLPVTFE